MATNFGPSALATPANALTMVRLAATPLLLAVMSEAGPSGSWRAFFVWSLLAGTDGVDGWLARRQGTTSSGAFLDPLADKFVILGAMAVLVVNGVFWWVPVLVIAGREVAVSVYRSWAGRRGVSVPARPLAKAKTFVQCLAVGFAVLPVTADDHAGVGDSFLWLAVGLSVVSGLQYLFDGREVARRAGAV
jgi:CDP-diacylglycerol--glycerol-3-phosphate 3-phosphatidyltransferase